MRIGIDARFYSTKFTGIGRYNAELIKHLALLDTENEYVIFLNNPEFENFQPPNERFKKVLAVAKHYSFSEQIGFRKKLMKENLDFVHFTHFNAPIRFKLPFVVTIHDLTLSFFPGKKMGDMMHKTGYKIVINNVVKRSKHIIAVSHNTKKDLMQYGEVADEKISVIHNGIGGEFKVLDNEKLFHAVAKKYWINKDFILYTGVWREHKNLVGLIKAFAELKKDEHFDGKLVITGREDKNYPEIKQTVHDLGLDDHVIFTGLVSEEELIALYNMAKVYVMPSFYEGFGLPVLEAMNTGTPVVSANTASLPEVVGEAGVLFDPYDCHEMAQKISLVWNDENLQKELVEKGFEQVKKFSWKKMAEETLNVYGKYKMKD